MLFCKVNMVTDRSGEAVSPGSARVCGRRMSATRPKGETARAGILSTTHCVPVPAGEHCLSWLSHDPTPRLPSVLFCHVSSGGTCLARRQAYLEFAQPAR